MKQFWLPFGLTPRHSNDPDGPRYADIYERAIASGIDLWLLYAVFNDLFLWLWAQISRGIDHERLTDAGPDHYTFSLLWQTHFIQLWLLNAGIQILILGLMIVSMQAVWFATPGKWLLGLKIVRADTLQRPARWRLIVRFLGYIPASACLMIGIIWISFNKQRRGWHDYLAGTAVIHIHPRGWYYEQFKRGIRLLIAKLTGKPSVPVE